ALHNASHGAAALRAAREIREDVLHLRLRMASTWSTASEQSLRTLEGLFVDHCRVVVSHRVERHATGEPRLLVVLSGVRHQQAIRRGVPQNLLHVARVPELRAALRLTSAPERRHARYVHLCGNRLAALAGDE